MVALVELIGCLSGFVFQVLSLEFFGFSSFGAVVLFCLLLSLVGFLISALWKGDGDI